jgi:uncharacterized protein (DUF1330 family)
LAKAYWIVAWLSVSDQEAVERYLAPANAAIASHGGRVIAAGVPEKAYEQGRPARAVLIEFHDLRAAISAYESPEYQAAIVHLRGAAERDVRIIEAMD